jgi:Xaa-Pro aminopeptidase
MFGPETYLGRRDGLRARLSEGLVLLPGNGESPMNYADNAYPFRQDSTFLYYLGLDQPELAGVVDVDTGAVILFGDELTVDDVVWTGELPTIAERAERAGVVDTRPRAALEEVLATAKAGGRRIHFLPPYRADTRLLLGRLLGLDVGAVSDRASAELIRAVVDQRSHKEDEEVAEMEAAVETSVAMHRAALAMAGPGVTERAIAAEVERIARAAGGRIAYPVIGTINGQTLHNHDQRHTLAEGDVFLLDCGAETGRGYAGDLTSSFPVGERFTDRQRAVYSIVLRAYDAAVARVAPGVRNLDVHLTAARAIFDGLKELGVARGDTEAAVEAGAHAIVFPHGIGHMIGLDVHDMESLGESEVGYAGQPRSRQFGLKSLRLARELEPGFVITIEPGIYFIPRLIDDWRASGRCEEFLVYEELDRWRDERGYRNEENFLVTPGGARRVGPRKPQTLDEMESRRTTGTGELP